MLLWKEKDAATVDFAFVRGETWISQSSPFAEVKLAAVASRERQWGGRVYRIAAGPLFVFVPKSLAVVDGREGVAASVPGTAFPSVLTG